jgi:prophage antirepressor-like protein
MGFRVCFSHNGLQMYNIDIYGTKEEPLFSASDIYRNFGYQNMNYYDFTKDFHSSEVVRQRSFPFISEETLTKKGVIKLISIVKLDIVNIFEQWVTQLFKNIETYGINTHLVNHYKLSKKDIYDNLKNVMYIFQADESRNLLRFGIAYRYSLPKTLIELTKTFPSGKLIFQKDLHKKISFCWNERSIDNYIKLLFIKFIDTSKTINGKEYAHDTYGYNISDVECKMWLSNLENENVLTKIYDDKLRKTNALKLFNTINDDNVSLEPIVLHFGHNPSNVVMFILEAKKWQKNVLLFGFNTENKLRKLMKDRNDLKLIFKKYIDKTIILKDADLSIIDNYIYFQFQNQMSPHSEFNYLVGYSITPEESKIWLFNMENSLKLSRMDNNSFRKECVSKMFTTLNHSIIFSCLLSSCSLYHYWLFYII